jgi:protocatechuate 3,4-dioxygenase beta subunit
MESVEMSDQAPSDALTRRQALRLIGTAGASVVALGRGGGAWAANCTVTPEETEGPYWVDELLERSDIRIDPSDGSVKSGVPLQLTINIVRADDNCSAAAGVQVDVWHCDAGGLYSDEAANNTVGKKFLRGYQITDANGAVQFTTIYPGWYSGRTIHIHFRIRTFDGSTTTSNFTSQLFFDETITNTALAQSPYNTRGTRDTTNATDNIYSAATLLALTSDGSGGYAGTSTVALDSLPAGTQTHAAAGPPTPTSTPTAIGSPAASCDGDCNADGQDSIDELVTLVDIALGNAQTATCANGIPTGTTVDVTLVKAVLNALNGCG